MLKSRIGYSKDADSFSSGKETALRAMESFNAPKLGIVACSCLYEAQDLLKGIQSITRDLPIIGCTTAGGIIIPDGIISSDQGFSGMMILDDEDLKVSVSGMERGIDPRETGKQIAIEAIKKAGTRQRPSYFCMIASPKEEELYLLGIQDIIGRVPCFGGSCTDDNFDGEGRILCGDQVISDGCAVAFFYSNKKMANEYTGNYRETKNMGVITKVEQNHILTEIDHTLSLQKYGEWISTSPDVLQGKKLLSASIISPLGIKDPQGTITIIRHPIIGNNDNTMNIRNQIVTGTAVICMETTVDELIFSTGETLKKVKQELKTRPGAYLLMHSAGRMQGIGDRLDEVYKNIKKEAGSTPFMMIFTFGEYGYAGYSANMCGDLMLSFTAFAE